MDLLTTTFPSYLFEAYSPVVSSQMSVRRKLLYFHVCFIFLTASLRYNSHTIQISHLKVYILMTFNTVTEVCILPHNMSVLLSHFVLRSTSPPIPCPQVHSLHLCLYSCPTTGFISTAF